ncbi:hypothetical protein GCM10009609_00020 [Pseudonocardia aurantiaca]|uniref:Histidine kinase n=1 Tax=Pseudonocardia aurantiaca TaxID=75290 RepID=A0ABW4G200_9PSEU
MICGRCGWFTPLAAADNARQHIERDLHDGIQQHLVALSLRVAIERGTHLEKTT